MGRKKKKKTLHFYLVKEAYKTNYNTKFGTGKHNSHFQIYQSPYFTLDERI